MANVKATDLITFTRASAGHALAKVSYGSELVTSGTFDDSSALDDWTTTGNVTASVSNGEVTISGDGGYNDGLQQIFNTTVGAVYSVTVTGRSITGNVTMRVRELGGTYTTIAEKTFTSTSNETVTLSFTAISSQSYVQLMQWAGSAGSGVFDNVSIKEVTFDQPDGTLQLFEHPDNIPRIEYDADGNLLGLLIEEARTNLVTHSHLDGANPTGWTTFALGGTRTATTLYGLPAIRFQATAERPLLQLPLTLSPSTTYTMSCYIENTGGTSEEVLELNGFSGVVGDDFIRANDGDSKCYASATFTTDTDASGYLRLGLGVGSSATGDVTITAIQIEQASFGTSYIKTQGSTASRSADVATIDVDQFGYNQSEGTLLIQASSSDDTPAFAALSDTTANNRMLSYVSSSNIRWYVLDGAAAQANIASGVSYSVGDSYKIANAYKANDFAINVNGATSVTDTSGNVSSGVSILNIGTSNNAGAPINGHIKSLNYYPKRLSNAKLQELTS